MADILQMTFSKAFSWQKNLFIPISPKFVPMGPIDNASALVRVMALQWRDHKLLPKTVMTVCSRHMVSLSHNHELPLIVGWNLHIYINSIFSQCHFEMAKVSCDFETYFVRHACGQFAADG